MTLADELGLIPGRVKLGSARLDNFYGPNWVWKVNLQTLTMFNDREDIGGQLYTTCGKALTALGFEDNGFTHGFGIENPHHTYSNAGIKLYFDDLTTEWFKRIVDLRSQRLHLQ